MNIKFICLITFILTSQNIFAKTSSMEATLDAYGHPISCKTLLVDSANKLINGNQHRLFIAPNAAVTRFPLVEGIIAYRDRRVNVSFMAYLDEAKSCRLTILQTYLDSNPCPGTREELFSKWKIYGNLDSTTMVLEREQNGSKQFAFLSEAMKDRSFCMISKHYDLNSPEQVTTK